MRLLLVVRNVRALGNGDVIDARSLFKTEQAERHHGRSARRTARNFDTPS
jgi:hypothetical protein